MKRSVSIFGLAIFSAGLSGLLVISALLFSTESLLVIPFLLVLFIIWYVYSVRYRGKPEPREPRSERHDYDAAQSQGHQQQKRSSFDRQTRTQSTNQKNTGQQHMTSQEAYKWLEIPPDAPNHEVRQAYRDKIKEVHPDRGGDEETFRQVRDAYEQIMR